MSEAYYGEAIELLRHGSQQDGVRLSYFQCGDLLHVIEDGQIDVLTAQATVNEATYTVNNLRRLLEASEEKADQLAKALDDSEEGAISMGKELDRLGKGETLCTLLYEKIEKWGGDVEEMVEEFGLEGADDAYHQAGGWEDEEKKRS